MSKYALGFFLLLTTLSVMGQKKSIVNLIRSQSSTGLKINGRDLIKVYQGTFKQDYSTLTSDSAYFYPKDNAFDAFGHVIINQGDTLNIYSDKLNYDGNTKVAILTDNVRMVDKDATLTTNHLNYNTATRIGTYTDGGKLVNKDNTLLSKNGYYFAFSRDAYFRYNVSLKTPDALVKTDTMRYNTKTKISYFYGPTDIYSTKNEKDKDTLYTENGDYNTTTEQARFGKHNLYHSGTKSLRGDSLFYDKIKGYGRAVKHVTFIDKEQKVTIKGNLGTYFKEEERTVVTEDPYVIMVTEEKDTTKTDSAARADSLSKLKPQKKIIINMAQLIKKTIPGKTDTANANSDIVKLKTDSLIKKPVIKGNAAINRGKKDSTGTKPDSVKLHANAAIRKPAGQKNTPKTKAAVKKNTVAAAAQTKTEPTKLSGKAGVKDTSKTKIDSVYMSADTIETRMLTYKNLKIYFEKQRLSRIRDTTKAKKPKTKIKESKFLTASLLPITTDTSYRQRNIFGKPKPAAVKKKIVKPLTKKQLLADSLNKKRIADSIIMAKKLEPNDTARIRIIIAHHHYKLFKSDLQAKADSMFYSNADSTIRCYGNPMMWTEGSQLSGDTIYLQMKHKKMDNMTMFPNAFIVNIEKGDSVHFNQVGGKRMRGYFKNDKLDKMIIEGNAESIYFSRDSGKTTISGMQRSLSTRISANFKDNKVTNMGFFIKPENRYGPLDKFKEDERILKGFIWKPKDRPVSKESIIPSYNKKPSAAKTAGGNPKTGKPPLKKLPDGKTARDSTSKMPAAKKDSTLKTMPGKLLPLKTGKDSVSKADTVKKPVQKNGKDTTIIKPSPVKAPSGNIKAVD